VKEPINKGRLARLLVAPAMVGALIGGIGIAAAQSDAPTTTTPSTTAAPGQSDSTATTAPADADKADGRGAKEDETVITGDAADKVKAAALEAVPGATVDRVESDADGYHAHLTKADGTHVTVQVDGAFKVTSVDEGKGGGGRHGDKGGRGDETALTGDTAAKVTAAAEKAVPGGTVDRVETDSDGSPYEAHVTKADGSHVTVKVNEAFEVTSVDADSGRGPRG
jgi:uncharacterized membrane protein YkoI